MFPTTIFKFKIHSHGVFARVDLNPTFARFSRILISKNTMRYHK